jgi:TIR domain-containing protein
MVEDQSVIFISYSRIDSDFAFRLRADLEASGFTTWIDTAKLNDQGGQEWLRLIQDAVDSCQAMVVIVSPESVQSRYVHMEYHRAQTQNKLVVPLHYRTVTSAPIDLDLAQWLDFREDQTGSDAYQSRLSNLIRSLAKAPTPPQYPDLPVAPAASPLTITEGVDIPLFRPVPSPPPPPTQEIQALITAAYDARGSGDLASEQYYIQQILAQDPSFLEGRLAQRLDDITRELESQRIQRLRVLGREAQSNEEWQRALGAWQALLDVLPDDPEAVAGAQQARIARAQVAFHEGEFDEAIGAWQALARNTPDDAAALAGVRSALRARADEAWNKADWKRAAESWETLRSLTPPEPNAQRYLDALAQNQRGDLLYQSAQRSLAVNSNEGARVALEDLYRDAPYYGDPAGIAPKAGLTAPPGLADVIKQAEDEAVAAQATSKSDEAMAAAAQAKRKADEATAVAAQATSKSDEAMAAAAQAKRKADEAASATATAVPKLERKADDAAAVEAKRKADEAATAAVEAKRKADEAATVATQAKRRADEAAFAASAASQATRKAEEAATAVRSAERETIEAAIFEAKRRTTEAIAVASNAKRQAETAAGIAVETRKQVDEATRISTEVKRKVDEVLYSIQAKRQAAEAVKAAHKQKTDEAKKERQQRRSNFVEGTLHANDAIVWLWTVLPLIGAGVAVGLLASSFAFEYQLFPSYIIFALASGSVLVLALLLYAIGYRRALPVPVFLGLILFAVAATCGVVWGVSRLYPTTLVHVPDLQTRGVHDYYTSTFSLLSTHTIQGHLFWISSGATMVSMRLTLALLFGFLVSIPFGILVWNESTWSDRYTTWVGPIIALGSGIAAAAAVGVALGLSVGGGWALLLGLVVGIVWEFGVSALVIVLGVLLTDSKRVSYPVAAILMIAGFASLSSLVVALVGIPWFGILPDVLWVFVPAMLLGAGLGSTITMANVTGA